MHLFVIRHATAEDAEPGTDDAARALTPAGKTKLKRVVRGLDALQIRFDRILTSPWQRAVQSAAVVGRISDTPPIATELLTQSPRAELLALIATHNRTTAVVGHEPWLGELAAWLAFGDTKHGDALDLKKAGVIWLEGSAVPGGMHIRAMLPPKLLRTLR